MFDSKSPLVKIVGYIIIGFFGLVIVFAFGVTDFMTDPSSKRKIYAEINGEKIPAENFYRFRDRMAQQWNIPSGSLPQINDIAFNQYSDYITTVQTAKKQGFEVPLERRDKTIMELPYFQDPATKKFSYDLFRMRALGGSSGMRAMSEIEFKDDFTNRMILRDFYTFIQMGASIASEDTKEEYICNNSQIQLKYAFISSSDLKKRYKDRITVSEEEVSEEMKKNPEDLTDPKTDKKRIETKLRNRKYNAVRKEIVKKINDIAKSKGSFAESSAVLQGTTGMTNIFKIGEKITEKDKGDKKNPKELTAISNSEVYLENCLSMEKGQSSSAIESSAPTGLYIFTPVIKEIKTGEASEKELESISKRLLNERTNAIDQNLKKSLRENSKITKKLKKN